MPKVQSIMGNINNLELTRIKRFLLFESPCEENKNRSYRLGKIDKELVYRIYKEDSKHSSKSSNNPFRHMAKDINISSKGYTDVR